MGQNRKQHYVPKLYLRHFTHNDDQLFVYDKKSGKTFPANKDDVAQEAFFYDIPAEAAKSPINLQIVEKTLSVIENFHRQAVEAMLALEPGQVLTNDDVHMMAHMVLFQYYRTRDYRNLMVEMHQKVYQDISDELVRLNHPPEMWHLKPQALYEDWAAGVHLSMRLLDKAWIHRAVRILVDRFWTLRINTTEVPLITSDSPVIVRSNDPAGLTFGFGPCSPAVKVALPLSPERLLFVSDQPPRILRRNGLVLALDARKVRLYNGLQVINGRRQLFSRSRDFVLAERMCRENPALREEANNRVKVAGFSEGRSRLMSVSNRPARTPSR